MFTHAKTIWKGKSGEVHCSTEKVFETEKLKSMVDNPEVLETEGISNVVIFMEKLFASENWHIVQVAGYTRDRGLFIDLY